MNEVMRQRRMSKVILYATALSLAVVSASSLYAEIPETTYTDKIIGKDEVADLTRVESVRHVIEVVRQPTIEDPVIELKVTQVVRAGVAEVDIVERTTRRGAVGHGGPAVGVLAAINIVNPVAWAVGMNPVQMTQHSFNQQVTNYRLTYQSKPRPLQDERKQDFKLAAQKLLLQLTTPDVFENFVFPYRTDVDGRAVVRLPAIISLLAQESVLIHSGRTLKLKVGTDGKGGTDIVTIDVPHVVLAQILKKKKEEERNANQK